MLNFKLCHLLIHFDSVIYIHILHENMSLFVCQVIASVLYMVDLI